MNGIHAQENGKNFKVSDKVTVISRAYGADKAYKWESSGTDGYTITECEKPSVGTDIIMHIKPDLSLIHIYTIC